MLPVSHGYDILKTPKFVERLVNEIIRRSNAVAPGGGQFRVYNLNNDRVNVNNNRE